MDRPITGTIIEIIAKVACGGCGSNFGVALEANRGGPVKDWSIFEYAIDAVRGGYALEANKTSHYKRDHIGSCSVQHGYLLCPTCTKDVDAQVPENEDRNATLAELLRALS